MDKLRLRTRGGAVMILARRRQDGLLFGDYWRLYLIGPAPGASLVGRDVHPIPRCKRRDGRRALRLQLGFAFGDRWHDADSLAAQLIPSTPYSVASRPACGGKEVF